MSLMENVLKSIYKYGVAKLFLIGKYRNEIEFKVRDKKNLVVNVKKFFVEGDLLLHSFELSSKEALFYIAYLVLYSCNKDQESSATYLEKGTIEKAPETTICAVNELYEILITMLSTDREYIEHLSKCNGNSGMLFECIVNSYEYSGSDFKHLSFEDMILSLKAKKEKFTNTLDTSFELWNKVKESNEEDRDAAYNKWVKFLNQLNKNEVAENRVNIVEELDDIDISYEFLTNKDYCENPAVHCEEELENLEIALVTPSKSAVLVGQPGVGKTTIVEGLSYLISTQQIPSFLKNKKILKINTSSIVKGCKFVGMFEDKVEKLMRYLIKNPDTILFVDELHTAIGLGTGNDSNLDLANLMKPYIDRGQIKVIGATTKEEYDRYIKSDKAFNRRFIKVNVEEPEEKGLYRIIEATIKKLEKNTNVKWSFEPKISNMIINNIIEATDEKNRIYDDKRYNPDISITILETAFALALLKDNQNVSIENIAAAIKKSEFLYKSARIKVADSLLNRVNFSNNVGCKIIPFTDIAKSRIKIKR